MNYEGIIRERLENKKWSQDIASRVMAEKRRRKRRNNSLFSLILFMVMSISVLSVNTCQRGYNGWQNLMHSWLDQEESIFAVTEVEQEIIIDY